MLPNGQAHRDGYPMSFLAVSRPDVPAFRQLLNILGCLVALPVLYGSTVHSRYPITFDIIITIALSELNRFVIERCRTKLVSECAMDEWQEKDPEKQLPLSEIRCMAAVVGWREDPLLYARALDSYKSARSCVFVIAGIDGDDPEDEDMVKIFNKVYKPFANLKIQTQQRSLTLQQIYTERSAVIHIPEPLGDVAERVRAKTLAQHRQLGYRINYGDIDAITMRYCVELAKAILIQHNLQIDGPDGVRYLCLRQRHMHKKGIMFTSFVFSLVIADILGIEFLWSSDSDTIVFPDSLEKTINTFAGDPLAGGASSSLTVHNAKETVVTALSEAVYWGELYLTRSTPAAAGTSDCQSGPSTAFRLAALPDILIPWYLQRVLGKRMIVNEDRHLTTNLLMRGWKVMFASDVLAATDTPTTMSRWLKQQVRWARATHIESLLHPRVYARSHPLLFYGMMKREFGPVIGAIAIVWYFLTSRTLVSVSMQDILLRIIVGCCYNVLRNPDRLTLRGMAWIVPSIFFYYIPLPAVHVWSMFTMGADGWGTTMRASSEKASKETLRKAWFETGFFVVWLGILGGVAAKLLAIKLGWVWYQRMAAIGVSSGIASYGAWRMTIGAL
ncbi:hypothetical protein VTJ04DRAFT_10946 [Mycothermus thermophilus]|uniref:uncharacterized protein n=1 Tax=Humicola insolens TaxID=85995 RepID=UPI0037449721